MQTVGVICEYNPFHLGHARQLAAVRQQLGRDTAVVCLMSGNYVQRGEPAVFDKGVRARAAVDAGADLVLELPALMTSTFIVPFTPVFLFSVIRGTIFIAIVHHTTKAKGKQEFPKIFLSEGRLCRRSA